MNYIGIDEAGLGPVLGVFCVGMTKFEAPEHFDFNLILGQLLNKDKSSTDKIVVDDSKKIFSKAKGIEILERTVLSVIASAFGCVPKNVGQLLNLLGADCSYKNIAWYSNLANKALPIKASLATCNQNGLYIKQQCQNLNVKILDLSLGFYTAYDFNKSLDKTSNKALTCQSILNQLMSKLDCNINARLVVDQQGGRRYYSQWLQEVFLNEVVTLSEGSGVASKYTCKNMLIEFHCKADQQFFEVALASLIAKYCREIFMLEFNNYWQNQVPSIKPTAGYPQDGKRFLQDLEDAKVLPNNIDMLRRKK